MEKDDVYGDFGTNSHVGASLTHVLKHLVSLDYLRIGRTDCGAKFGQQNRGPPMLNG